MTTETPRRPRDWGAVALVRTAVSTLGLGLIASAAAALIAGSAAAYAVLLGTLIVVGVFGFGTFSLHVVARVMPAMSLALALLTYLLQVLVTAVIFIAIAESGLLEDGLDRAWLGGTVILGTLLWMAAQVRAATDRRIPIYDLPDYEPPVASSVASPAAPSAASSTATEASER